MINFRQNVPLKNYSNYKIGGPAHLFAEVKSVEELKEILKQVWDDKEKFFILAGGTKVLINDKGFNGLVIYNKIEGIKRDGNNLIVGSGVLVKNLLDYCIDNSLSGLEWAGGLPGTVGGAVRGNAGSFGGEIKDNVIQVESLNLKNLSKKTRQNKKCGFTYRCSIFKLELDNLEFITYVTLGLKPGDREEIKKSISQKIAYRQARQPLEYPSIGSTFKNIPFASLSGDLQKKFASIVKNDPFPVIPIAKILACCGLKGRRIGGAMISGKHPNFIVNMGNAKAADVKALIEIAKRAARKKYNLILKEEIIYL